MIWSRATILLVAVFTACCAWMYLRDRPGAPLRGTPRSQAQDDANELLAMLGAPAGCRDPCAADVLGRPARGSWLVRLSSPSWRQCFVVRLDSFGYSHARGFSGLASSPCR